MPGAVQKAYRRPGQTLGDPTFLEKLDLVPGISSLAWTIVWGMLTAGFRGPDGADTFKHHVSHAVIRKVGARLSTAQIQYISPAFPDLYRAYCKQKHIKPSSFKLKYGAEAFWIGSPTASNIVIYFHGGGFSMDGDYDHIRFWADEVGKEINAGSADNVAFLFLAYTLVPFATYPTQIYEAAEVLHYVLTELKRSPSEITLAGDSAGANMCLALLSLMLHPHPELPEVSIDKPLKALVLVCPWLSFRMDYPSVRTNAQKDILNAYSEAMWARDYLAAKSSTPYAEPLDADAEWWQGAEQKVSRCFCTSGGNEILLDHTTIWAEKYKSVTPEKHLELVIAEHECHIAPIIEPLLLDKTPTGQGIAILDFFKRNYMP